VVAAVAQAAFLELAVVVAYGEGKPWTPGARDHHGFAATVQGERGWMRFLPPLASGLAALAAATAAAGYVVLNAVQLAALVTTGARAGGFPLHPLALMADGAVIVAGTGAIHWSILDSRAVRRTPLARRLLHAVLLVPPPAQYPGLPLAPPTPPTPPTPQAGQSVGVVAGTAAR
jgi:hypothetical protein